MAAGGDVDEDHRACKPKQTLRVSTDLWICDRDASLTTAAAPLLHYLEALISLLLSLALMVVP